VTFADTRNNSNDGFDTPQVARLVSVHTAETRSDTECSVLAMSQFDPCSGRLAPAMRSSFAAWRVARMARFGVRSGSLGRSLKKVIPRNQPV